MKMADLDPEDITRPLNNYTFEVDPGLTCDICCNLMVDAYRADCGCKYCCGCIVTSLENGNTHCRGDSIGCQQHHLVFNNNVVQNDLLNERIQNVTVHCANQGCEFTSKLSEIEDHLRVCLVEPSRCPYRAVGCGNEGISGDILEAHLHDETLSHSALLMEVIDNIRNELGGVREELQIRKLEISSLRAESASEDSRHLLEEAMEEVRMLRGNNEVERERSNKMRVEMVEVQGELKMVKVKVTRLDSQNNEMAEGQKELRVVKESVARLEAGNAEIRRKAVEVETAAAAAVRRDRLRVDKLTARMDSLTTVAIKDVAVGQLRFKVDDLTERIKKGRKERMDSQFLFSHTNGYKLRLGVQVAGGPSGRHLCVCVAVCQGEYDDWLLWPCGLAVVVSVVNQYTKEPLRSRSLTNANTRKECLNKPTWDHNDASGDVALISHAELRSIDGLVVDDSVLLHAIVGLP